MKIVFLPLDQKMESTIIDNVQLIGGQRIFPLFGKLIVHVESYKAVVANRKGFFRPSPVAGCSILRRK